MKLDQIEGKPDDTVSWGSDIAAQMLRRFGMPFISLNPGASYRGFHDSLVNHLGNENPGIILCLHEDHSVAIAHGYAKATGEPMACVLHSNVGLLHGMMGLFNAWCDRVPMMVLGATGPVAAEKRRPWIDWIHTSRDQGAYVRSIIKWDDQPTSPAALVESMARGNMMTRSAPTAPVYIVLDAGFQESRLDKEPEWPDLKRFQAPKPSRPAKDTLDQIVSLLSNAKKPIILFGRGSRQDPYWQPRIRLAERLGACVFTDLKQGAMFPSDHPAHYAEPFNAIVKEARQLMCEADVILSLDWMDLGGALRQAKTVGTVTAKIISCSLDQNLHTGANMEYQELAPCDVFAATTGDTMVAELNAALGESRRDPWKAKLPAKQRKANGALTMEVIAQTLRDQFNDPDNVTFCTLGRGWPTDIWPLQNGMSYLGKDGGGGLGSGPGISVGSALALHHKYPGRYAISMLGDGDFCMGATAIWSAVKHRIPLLIIVNNNRSYFNDELHQDHVAKDRGREPKNRWIGLRMEDPVPNIAKFAEAQGAVGIGPVTSQQDARAAIAKGVDILKKGGVCVIDFHVDPPDERQASHGLGYRATGN
ncbi:MAG: acetolactate synthase large subunit [Alphaproteobacteria bacterium]|jgi:thiamine pyrophosphate-dependent acetolactate synthase large subunit-like protein|nr:acetolactate synthase large subunit [Alphaproteobacteria bacterium]MEA2938062.1 acetolactate synthase large subunit [Alphaproteobacteria bacterium]MEA2987767.1 acetolactate synthase large subunit [Alphaproteobacteria bacterium]